VNDDVVFRDSDSAFIARLAFRGNFNRGLAELAPRLSGVEIRQRIPGIRLICLGVKTDRQKY
jgi:hypothetical protein